MAEKSDNGQERDLTSGPLAQDILALAVPAALGMIFNTLYNVVDTYFAGTISTKAQAALSISFPVFFLVIAFGAGLSQGLNAVVANRLGRDEDDAAASLGVQGLMLAACLGVLLTVVGLLALPWIFTAIGASGEHRDLALDYMNLLLLSAPLFLVSFAANGFLSAQGNTRPWTIALGIAFALNIALNPLLIHGALGMPGLGFNGIALATILIHSGVCLFMVYRSLTSNLLSERTIGIPSPDLACWREIMRQGAPASANMLTVSFGIFIIQWFLESFGETAVAAYGVATRVEQLVLLPVVGLNMALLSIVGQNSGASNQDRIRQAFLIAHLYGFALVLIGGMLLYPFAPLAMSLFSDDQAVIDQGSAYLRIAVFILPAYVTLFLSKSTLQGLERPYLSLLVGVYRQLLAQGVIIWLLAFGLGWGTAGVWWGILISTWTGVVLSLTIVLYVARKELDLDAPVLSLVRRDWLPAAVEFR